MDSQKPSVGRTVHVKLNDECLPAIIIESFGDEHPWEVSLWIFGHSAIEYDPEAIFEGDKDADKDDSLRKWHWPERV